jgi:hypothetical protein
VEFSHADEIWEDFPKLVAGVLATAMLTKTSPRFEL